LIAEEPASVPDLQKRADHEVARQYYSSVECNVIVQGWKRHDGQLWDVKDLVSVKSPMIFPTSDGTMKLGVHQVTFTQDESGTKTRLDLCLPNALSTQADAGVRGQVPNMLETQPAQPAPENTP
jgi:prophage tail gpP-like protein